MASDCIDRHLAGFFSHFRPERRANAMKASWKNEYWNRIVLRLFAAIAVSGMRQT